MEPEGAQHFKTPGHHVCHLGIASGKEQYEASQFQAKLELKFHLRKNELFSEFLENLIHCYRLCCYKWVKYC